MNTNLTEPGLIRAIQHRKRIAAEALYDQYAAIIFKMICSKVQDRVVAEAVMEATFLQVWNNINDYQLSHGRLLIWITKIARSLAMAANISPVAGLTDAMTGDTMEIL